MPRHSRAAAAQRLGELPQKANNGTYYDAPQTQLHPTGWRTKRHIKRRNLRLSNLTFLKSDRVTTRWAMLPMSFTILTILVLVISSVVGVTALVQATQQRYTPQITTLRDILPKDHLRIYDKNNTQIYQMLTDGMQTSEPLDQISPHLMHAEIAIEDQYFWTNPGYDITGLVRAAVSNLASGHIVSGGSTITQQLIKNTVVGNRDTALRKLQEIILAPEVTRKYTKQDLMEMYLNTTYYGEQAYGAESAAFTYFNLHDKKDKSAASQMDIAQAATIAGIPSSPISRDPLLHPKASLQRTQDVLKQMHAQEYITDDEYHDALREIAKPDFLKPGSVKTNKATNYTNYVLRELEQTLHVRYEDLPRSGLKIQTSLDQPFQDQVLKIAQRHIADLAEAHNMSNAAVVVINYRTGDIRAIVGNIHPDSATDGSFDVATQGLRQPGSSFKPFIYATAFGKGVSPEDTVVDEALTIPQCCGLPAYSPKNYDLKFHGAVTYRYALQNSLNIPAVKLLMQTGVDDSLKTAQNMGISAYQGTPNYTMVLGTLSVHLLDETSAYGAFANDGVHVPAHAVSKILDSKGKVIFENKPKSQRVLTQRVARTMSDVMSDNNSRTFEFGKCSPLLLYSTSEADCNANNPGQVRQAAAKTGTSNDFVDNWTVGYDASNYVVGVWAGNNDNSPMVNVSGIDGAAPIWHETLMLAEQDQPIKTFIKP